MKKVFSLVLFVILTVAVSVTAFAADSDIIASGYCGAEGDGTNVVWTFGSDGVMTFSGTGAMADYGYHYTQEFGFITNAPWWIYADQVKLIVIEENITYFGAYALDNFGGIAVVKGQPYFGEKSLYMQDGLPSVYFFGGPPAGAHETAYNSVYKMYYLESTEDQWDIQSGFWQGHRMYPYTIPDEAEFNPADFTYSGYCGTDPFILGKEIAWGYDSESKTLTIMGTGNMQNYEPDYVDAPWYPYHEDVEKIVVNEGIIEIGDYSFYKFSNIKEISLPSTAVKIGKGAFCDAKISGGFEIPENVEVAHEYAFSDFTAAWLYIPQKTSFAYSTFSKNKIGEFRVSGDSWSYSVNDGVLMSKNGEYLISFPGARKGEYSVPEKVKYISENSFAGSNIDKVFIPKNVQAIRTNAFIECAGIFVFEGTTQIADKTFSSRLNSTVSIYFMGGEPSRTSSSFIDKKTNKGKVNLYYLSGTEDLWEFNENGLWGIYEVKPFTAYEEVELDPSLYVASGYCGADPLTDGKNLAWGIDENGTLTIFGKGEMESYSRPVSTLGGDGSVGAAGIAPWYKYEGKLTGLVIEEGITNIGSYAFWSMDIPGELKIPSSVKIIGDWSFCANDFVGDNLIIPEGVKIIENAAFQAAGIFENAYIPASVIDTQGEPFRYCETKNIFTDENNQHYKSVGGVFFTKDGKELVQFPDGRTGSYVVPETVNIIGASAFESSLLSSVIIEGNIDSIENVAFQAFNGTVVFNGTVSEIAGAAFSTSSVRENKLKVIFMAGPPKTFISGDEWSNSFGEGCAIYYLSGTEDLWEFDENGLWNGYEVKPFTAYEEVEFDPSLYVASGYCGADQFTNGKNLAWGIDKNGVLKIFGKGEMANYSLIKISGSEDILSDAPWVNHKGQIKKLVIEEGVTTIGSWAFPLGLTGNCNIPSTIKVIRRDAFIGNNFTGDLVIPEGVENIGDSAFQAAGDFGYAYIPSTVTDIGGSPFRYCSLEEIVVHEDNPNFCAVGGVLFSKDQTVIYQFPQTRTGEYIVPDSVNVVGEGAFEEVYLSKIIFNSDIESIGNSAFSFNQKDIKIIFKGKVGSVMNAVMANANAEIFFLGGAPESVRENSDKYGCSFGSNMGKTYTIYYVDDGSWSFDENGLWNGYEVTEYSGYGDLNSDFTVDVKDVYLARLAAAKLVVPTEEEFSFGDVDGNGRINAIDANLIRKFCANIITKFPVEG